MFRKFLLAAVLILCVEMPVAVSFATERTAPGTLPVVSKKRVPDRAVVGCKGTNRPDLSCEALSAQAALDQAHYAGAAFWIGLAQALVAFLTLLAAVGAAIFARSASQHAGRSVEEAKRGAKAAEDTLRQSREVAHSDQRAWIGIEVELLDAKRTTSAAHFDVEVRIENVGRTPALRVGVDVHVYIANSIQIGHGSPPRTDGYKHHMPSLLPGNSATQRIGERLDNEAIKAGMDTAKRSGSMPIVFIDATVSYHTIFDAETDPVRLTSIRYIATPMTDLSARDAYFRWLEGGPSGTNSVIFRQQRDAPIHMT